MTCPNLYSPENDKSSQKPWDENSRKSYLNQQFTTRWKLLDRTTIWAFRKRLTEASAMKGWLATFERVLSGPGYQATRGGQVVDSTLVSASRQCLDV